MKRLSFFLAVFIITTVNISSNLQSYVLFSHYPFLKNSGTSPAISVLPANLFQYNYNKEQNGKETISRGEKLSPQAFESSKKCIQDVSFETFLSGHPDSFSRSIAAKPYLYAGIKCISTIFILKTRK